MTILFLSIFSVNTFALASTSIISKNNSGLPGDGDSANAFVSQDGKFVAFASDATNLILGDTNTSSDVFVYDIQGDTLERISVSSSEVEGDGNSAAPVLSEDGRYVAFYSEATNLVTGDTNGVEDVFIRDRTLGTTEIISLTTGGLPGNNTSYYPSISKNGRYVAFYSAADNLVAGDTNSAGDVFLYDRVLDSLERISLDSDEQEIPEGVSSFSFSPDERYLVFQSGFVIDAGDTNLTDDVFLRDLTLGTTEIISVSSSESFSDSGSNVNYQHPAVSEDGRYVVFGSGATNLVTGDTNGELDVFVRDRTLGTTERISTSSSGIQGNDSSTQGSISPDGRYVSFYSSADNLVAGDMNILTDVFIRDIFFDLTERVVNDDGVELNGISLTSVSNFKEFGRFFTFLSASTNIVSGTGGFAHIYLKEREDNDGIESALEDVSPNSGDVDDDGYDDSIEGHISSFINTVSGSYTTVETTGDCISNSNISVSNESSLASQDTDYDYPLGIVSFQVDCKNSGETATVSVYTFSDDAESIGTITRKYNENTGEYTTIDSAVIEEVTIGGQRALKMTYDVVDGGELDEDGLSNGTIIDPVGFARVATSSGGGSSSGSHPSARVSYLDNNVPAGTNNDQKVCTIFTTPMKKGSKYGEVSKLQTSLNSLGFKTGVADGLFGPLTDTAVKAFQKSKKLSADGIVGPITRSALNDCK